MLFSKGSNDSATNERPASPLAMSTAVADLRNCRLECREWVMTRGVYACHASWSMALSTRVTAVGDFGKLRRWKVEERRMRLWAVRLEVERRGLNVFLPASPLPSCSGCFRCFGNGRRLAGRGLHSLLASYVIDGASCFIRRHRLRIVRQCPCDRIQSVERHETFFKGCVPLRDRGRPVDSRRRCMWRLRLRAHPRLSSHLPDQGRV